ncbi:MAG TPA: CDP-alcohol phosphatidyltransferase family protein [Acidimicrobiia bacterium]|jgi:cardiolipin synthase|nr:CDP-alcohol phosphatidyltransferase family protein [Acidimicrobiia bacterium]
MPRQRVLTIPNLISVVRLACAPLLVWLLLGVDDKTAAFVVLAVLGTTDWVDGWIARHYDQGSELGKILDPTADRILLLTAGIALLIEGSLPVAVGVAVLLREVLVAGATLGLAAAGARRIDVRWAGKAGTLALMFALPGFLLVHIVDPGPGRTVILSLTWLATIGGLILSYWAAAAYVPAARDALREGRRARAERIAA